MHVKQISSINIFNVQFCIHVFIQVSKFMGHPIQHHIHEYGNRSQDLLPLFVIFPYPALCIKPNLSTCLLSAVIGSFREKSRLFRKLITFLGIIPESLHSHCGNAAQMKKQWLEIRKRDRLFPCNIPCLLFPRGSFPCKIFATFYQ